MLNYFNFLVVCLANWSFSITGMQQGYTIPLKDSFRSTPS